MDRNGFGPLGGEVLEAYTSVLLLYGGFGGPGGMDSRTNLTPK